MDERFEIKIRSAGCGTKRLHELPRVLRADLEESRFLS
jgi:hypothetical protein